MIDMPVWNAFFKLAIPAIAAQLINILYNLVDKMFIGRIPGVGKQALAGVGVTAPVILAISAFAALVSMGGAPKASIFMLCQWFFSHLAYLHDIAEHCCFYFYQRCCFDHLYEQKHEGIPGNAFHLWNTGRLSV